MRALHSMQLSDDNRQMKWSAIWHDDASGIHGTGTNMESAMAPQAIFGPFFAMMVLTLIVWVYMYVRRIHFITTGKLNPQDLAVPGELARLSPPAVGNPADNFKNLFELPVLFYALTLYLYATGRADFADVYAGWIFATFRALHSAIHCTVNIVMLRFWLYAIATAALWFMLIRAALTFFSVR